MAAKYENKFDKFYSNKPVDELITEVAAAFNMSKVDVAELVQHFFKWQLEAFESMLAPSYSWYGFGSIQVIRTKIHEWDKIKEEALANKARIDKQRELNKLNRLTKLKDHVKNEQTDEK